MWRLKTNITFLGIFLVISTFLVATSYFKGRADAREACTNKYEAQIARERIAAMNAIGAKLTQVHSENRKLRLEYEELNRQISEGVFTKTETIYRTVEKAVEKPVYVEGECSIDYAGVASVFDAIASAATDN